MAFSGKIGNDWTGEYSRWIFDESKAYMLVAKMMKEPGTLNGIPLLDAELNEQGEILIQLIRRLIKRIYGNGSNNNGFKIVQSGSNPNNNFTIKGGDGTVAGAGSLFVEGWMPFLESDMEYTAQSYGPAALTTPGVNRTDEVYIDVYYDEIDSSEDSAIEDATVGLETSRRIALIWEVKVVEGGATPTAYTDANNVYHWTMKVATLNRLAGNASITDAMIVDARNAGRKVSLASELVEHAALSNPHNATSAATADRLILRDVNGRAQIAAPSAANDIARKADVDLCLKTANDLSELPNKATARTNLEVYSKAAIDSAMALKLGKYEMAADSVKLNAKTWDYYRCTTCSWTCKGGCTGTCGASCTGTCSTTCTGTCIGGCTGTCLGGCGSTCTGGCGTGCSSSCTGTCTTVGSENP